jgi:CBS domain-containing protein
MACARALGNAQKPQLPLRAMQAGQPPKRIRFLARGMAFFALKERREPAMTTIARIIAQRKASDIISCEVDTPLAQAVKILAHRRIGALPVLREGEVVGIISERDVIYHLADQGAACLDLPVGAVMTAPVVTVAPATTVDEALAMMTNRRFRHIPVVEEGALVGFISIGDLVKHKLDEVQHEAEALRHYIQAG